MKILLADDHDLVRETLALFLRSEGLGPIVQAGTVDGAEAALAAAETPFDIILLDYDMPGMDGMAGLHRMCLLAGDRPVAILTGISSRLVARRTIAAGARGFLPKTLGTTELARAVRLIATGEIYLPPDILDQSDLGAIFPLTLREGEVLRGLYAGLSNKEIARDLALQEVTIKLHVRTLCRKLGARNRTQAAMIARDRHLVG